MSWENQKKLTGEEEVCAYAPTDHQNSPSGCTRDPGRCTRSCAAGLAVEDESNTSSSSATRLSSLVPDFTPKDTEPSISNQLCIHFQTR